MMGRIFTLGWLPLKQVSTHFWLGIQEHIALHKYFEERFWNFQFYLVQEFFFFLKNNKKNQPPNLNS
jgi:hypothetical protein